MAGEPKLRTVETLDKPGAKATYEVLLDGVVIGDVTKYEQQSHDYRQHPTRARKVTRTFWLGRVRGRFAYEMTTERSTRSYALYDVRANYFPEVADGQGSDSEGEN
jgi:predicted RNA-binding protein with PUA domain